MLVKNQYDSDFDPYYQLDKLRTLSPNVDGYFANKPYLPELKEVGLEDMQIDDKVTKAYDIICDELTVLGIQLSHTKEEVLSSYMKRELVYYLRYMFSVSNVVETMLSLPQELLDEVNSKLSVIENDEPADDMINQLVYLLHLNYPNNLLYAFLNDHTDMFMCEEKFVKYLLYVLSQLPERPDKPDLDLLIPYLQFMDIHTKLVKIAVELIIDKHDVDKELVLQALAVHDDDKIQNDKLKAFAFTHKEGYDNDEFIYEKQHHLNNNHHVEYYESRGLNINPTALFLIVTDLYGYSKTMESLKEALEKLIAKHPILETSKALAFNMISNLNYVEAEKDLFGGTK